jgi:UDP-N-acetyl-D-mannosaminuronate dehydrogenase
VTGVAQTTVKVGVIGLGHVGLPSAVGFAKLYVTDIETGIDRCEGP